MTTSPPSRIRLGARIASGGMAEVFAARLVGPAGFEKDVAVKRVLPRYANNPVFLQRFLTEARLAALLSHPHIVQIFELGQDGGDHYIVMEAVRGVTLRELIRRLDELGERLPRGVALLIARALCAGLGHAHERTGIDGQPLRIIHRDVSPHNVLLGHDGAIKLIDFGIAQAADSERLTQVGRPVGKPWYMAPEQLSSSSSLDARADLYAVGVILHELLTGQRPFEGSDEGDLVARVRAGRRRPLGELAPDLEAPIADLVERAVAVRREDRPATARVFAAELGAVIEATGLRADAHTLEGLLQRLVPGELARPWPVDDDRSDEADHTRTGVVAREITLSAESDTGNDTTIVARTEDVTAPVAGAPPSRGRGLLAAVVGGVMAAGALGLGVTAFVLADDGVPAVADGGSVIGGVTTTVAVDAGSTPAPIDAVPAVDGVDGAIAAPSAVDLPIDEPVAATIGDELRDPPPARRQQRAARRDAAREARRAPAKKGQLVVETRPWSEVRLDGLPIGQTPLQREIRVGRHLLILEHPPLGLRRELIIEVTADAPTVVRIDLRAP